MADPGLIAALAPLLDMGRDAVFAVFGVFTRVGAMVALLPGFGEITLSPRLKLGAAVAFTVIIWPAVAPLAPMGPLSPGQLGALLGAEAAAGALLGLSVRLMLMALQTAGAIAAQSTSIAQMFGSGVTAELQAPYANLLTLAGVALAFALGLPAWTAAGLIGSYEVAPFGALLSAADVAEWGVERVAGAFAIAAALASPFLVTAFAYNVALGAINRAMPQLMVAMVGAPAITLGSILLMGVASPLMLEVWADRLEQVLAAPFSATP